MKFTVFSIIALFIVTQAIFMILAFFDIVTVTFFV